MIELDIGKDFEKQAREMQRTLASLPAVFADTLTGDMCYAIAQFIAKKGKASNAFRDQTGYLRDSFRAVRIDVTTGDGREVDDGGARALMGGKKAPHGHLIELGTVSRVQSTTGRRTGRVQARLPLTMAFESGQDQAMDEGRKVVKRNFKKFVKAARKEGKVGKRHAKILGL